MSGCGQCDCFAVPATQKDETVTDLWDTEVGGVELIEHHVVTESLQSFGYHCEGGSEFFACVMTNGWSSNVQACGCTGLMRPKSVRE